MIKTGDYFLLCLGILFLVLGVRGYDLGSFEHWKYYTIMALGIIFLLLSINHNNKSEEKKNV